MSAIRTVEVGQWPADQVTIYEYGRLSRQDESNDDDNACWANNRRAADSDDRASDSGH